MWQQSPLISFYLNSEEGLQDKSFSYKKTHPGVAKLPKNLLEECVCTSLAGKYKYYMLICNQNNALTKYYFHNYAPILWQHLYFFLYQISLLSFWTIQNIFHITYEKGFDIFISVYLNIISHQCIKRVPFGVRCFTLTCKCKRLWWSQLLTDAAEKQYMITKQTQVTKY